MTATPPSNAVTPATRLRPGAEPVNGLLARVELAWPEIVAVLLA